jgi:hypothetical protein
MDITLKSSTGKAGGALQVADAQHGVKDSHGVLVSLGENLAFVAHAGRHRPDGRPKHSLGRGFLRKAALSGGLSIYQIRFVLC